MSAHLPREISTGVLLNGTPSLSTPLSCDCHARMHIGRMIRITCEPHDRLCPTVSLRLTLGLLACLVWTKKVQTSSLQSVFNMESAIESSLSPSKSVPALSIPKCCPVCMRKLKKCELGKPATCSHVFCFICLYEWSKVSYCNDTLCKVKSSFCFYLFHMIPVLYRM